MCKVTITLEGQVKGLNPITRPLSVQLIIAVDVQRAHTVLTYATLPPQLQHTQVQDSV